MKLKIVTKLSRFVQIQFLSLSSGTLYLIYVENRERNYDFFGVFETTYKIYLKHFH